MELSKVQREIVNSPENNILVIAGPGSGKTRVLTYRVASLIKKGVKPYEIILLTFTNKAAKNMLDRIQDLVDMDEKVLGGTFHHVANHFLRIYNEYIGFPKNYTIIDSQDAVAIIKSIIREKYADLKEDLPKGETLHKIYSYCSNSGMKITDYVKNFRPEFEDITKLIVNIRQEYQTHKMLGHMMDFDDLLIYFLKILENQSIADQIKGQYKYLLVDEFQDTNRIQYEILKRLYNGNIFVVGDDSQSIYSFRAAEIKNMFRFKKEFAAKVYILGENFRSKKPIVDLVNHIIKHNKYKYEKELLPKRDGKLLPELIYFDSAWEESRYIAQSIKKDIQKGVRPSEIAVLYRSNYLSAYLETELMREGLAYIKLGGKRFFELAHVKDMVAYLKVIEGIEDELAWVRLLKLFEGIGENTAKNVWKSIKNARNPYDEFVHLRYRKLLNVIKILQKVKEINKRSLGEKIRKFIDEYYNEYLKIKYRDSYEERLDDLNQLIAFLGNYENIDEFLEDAMLDMDIVESNTPEDKVVISTIHQAKGLEWEYVYILGLANNRFPSKHVGDNEWRIEEERRLFYVATSRAKSKLVMTVPLSDNTGWNYKKDFEPSIFVREIPKELVNTWNHFDKKNDDVEIGADRGNSRKHWGGGWFSRADNFIEDF